MSRRTRRLSRRIGVESLEGRLLMAGDVAVSVSGGDLVITGDVQENQITVIQSQQNGAPIAGRYFITGQNGTTINGQAAGQFFANVTDDILINLGGANDRLTVGNGVSNGDFIVPDDLEITMGDGADVVTINKISVRDDATITTGAGNDSVSVKASIGGLAGVDNGFNNLSIDTGDRADNVLLQNTFVRRDLTINTGTDGFGDIVDLVVMNIGNDTDIRTGGGGDNVRISDVGFNDDLSIDTGAGNDFVSIDDSEMDELFAALGSNDDELRLTDTFGQRASLNGGADADTLFQSNNSFSELFQFLSF